MDKTKVKAEFSIFGDEFNTSDITRKLNIEPNNTYNKGDYIRKNIFRKETAWQIYTEYEECSDINYVLIKILDKISDKIDILVSIKNLYDVQLKFEIVINVENNETPSMCLDEQTIEFMGKIKAYIDFYVYIYS